MSVKIAVVYHSGYGHTERMAKAVVEGMEHAGANVSLVKATEVEPTDDVFAEADAIVFGSPTYMGSVAAELETFFDASSKVWFGQGWKDKIAGGFTNSGSPSGDKVVTLVRMATIAAQHGMIWIGVGELSDAETGINRLGGYIGAMAQSDNAPPEEGNPPKEDLMTARHYGVRIANLTLRWRRGTDVN
ncbi:MAG: flavodoxin family protein [Pacificimonas sp.]